MNTREYRAEYLKKYVYMLDEYDTMPMVTKIMAKRLSKELQAYVTEKWIDSRDDEAGNLDRMESIILKKMSLIRFSDLDHIKQAFVWRNLRCKGEIRPGTYKFQMDLNSWEAALVDLLLFLYDGELRDSMEDAYSVSDSWKISAGWERVTPDREWLPVGTTGFQVMHYANGRIDIKGLTSDLYGSIVAIEKDMAAYTQIVKELEL